MTVQGLYGIEWDSAVGERRIEVMQTSLESVVFLGGPLDGYHRAMTPEMLARLIEFDINANTFRIMAHQQQLSGVRTTSTAVYQLGWIEGAPRYHFVAAVAPQEDAPRWPPLVEMIRAALRRVTGHRNSRCDQGDQKPKSVRKSRKNRARRDGSSRGA
jgi:hypothetical protein